MLKLPLHSLEEKTFLFRLFGQIMFLKVCRSSGLNPLVEFIKLAAQEITPNNSDSGSDDDEENDFF